MDHLLSKEHYFSHQLVLEAIIIIIFIIIFVVVVVVVWWLSRRLFCCHFLFNRVEIRLNQKQLIDYLIAS